MSLTPATNKQLPDHAILDYFNKQIYLGNGFSVPQSLALSGTSENLLYLVQNPVTSTSFPSSYKSLFLNLRKYLTTLQNVVIKIYQAGVVATVSTASTAQNLRPASSNASIAGVYVNGQFTMTSNGTLMSELGVTPSAPLDDSMLVIVDPGQSILITATALVTTTTVQSTVSWYEL